MPAKTLYIVQQFERQGRKLVTGRQMDFPSAAAATARAERDAAQSGKSVVGAIAVQQTVDIDTGEVLEEPIYLAAHGEMPAGLFAE